MTLAQLHSRLEAMPPGSLVPASWVLEQLVAVGVQLSGPDLSAAELATRWRRGASTVRTMCEKGELPGAFKRGREWRIPRATIEAHETRVDLQSDSEAGDLQAIARGLKTS